MPTVKPLDHITATDTQKRSHYSSGCRDQACKDAVAAYQRASVARRKAAALAAAGDTKPSSEEEKVEPPVSTPTPGTAATDSAPVTPSSLETPTILPKASQGGPALPHPAPAAIAGRTSARGASRRLQALVWLGYPPVELAKATQISIDAIWWLLFTPPETIQDVNHRIIVTHYNRLKIMPPELAEPIVRRSKELAGDHGWCGPFDWDDIDTDAKAAHGKRLPTRAEMLQERVDELEGELAKRLEYSAPTAVTTFDFDTRAELTKVQQELTAALQTATDRQTSLELEQTLHAATKMNLAQAEGELIHLGSRYQELSAEGEQLAAQGEDLAREGAALAAAVAAQAEAIDALPADEGLTLTGMVLGQRIEIPVVLRLSVALGE